MKKIICLFVAATISLALCNTVFAQVQLKVSRAISDEDFAKIEAILKSFDPNSYKLVTSSTDARQKTKARSLGLASVEQTYTKNNIKPQAAATVNTINIFKNAKAATVNTINIFKAATVNTINIFKAATVNTINIFKPSDTQLSKMDELHSILNKYSIIIN